MYIHICLCRVEDTPLSRRPCRRRARFFSLLLSIWCERHPAPLRRAFNFPFCCSRTLHGTSCGSLRIRVGVFLHMKDANKVADTARPSIFRFPANERRFQPRSQRLCACVRVTTALDAHAFFFVNVGHGGSDAFVVRRCGNVLGCSAA